MGIVEFFRIFLQKLKLHEDTKNKFSQWLFSELRFFSVSSNFILDAVFISLLREMYLYILYVYTIYLTVTAYHSHYWDVKRWHYIIVEIVYSIFKAIKHSCYSVLIETSYLLLQIKVYTVALTMAWHLDILNRWSSDDPYGSQI